MGAATGIVFRVKKYAIHDGPGIRTTLFLKGCPLSCWWCHNPEGQDPQPQKISPAQATGRPGENDAGETIGREITVDQVLAQIVKDLIFYDESGGGATFSGGEPLMQPEFLAALLDRCRNEDIHTAVDTSGFAAPEIFADIAGRSDLLLFDLKLMDDRLHQSYTGVSNRQILENLRAAGNNGSRVRIRFPVIPGITDGEDNLRQLARFMGSLKRVPRIDLLPFHRTGKSKYSRLGLENKMETTRAPSEKTVQRVKTLFQSYGFNVSLGG